MHCSILAWMSAEMEVTMRRGNQLEASLARMENLLSDNQEAVTRGVEVMTAGNRTTDNSYKTTTAMRGRMPWREGGGGGGEMSEQCRREVVVP